MKLKDLLDQLNQLAKERPEALEMEVCHQKHTGEFIEKVKITLDEEIVYLIGDRKSVV